MLPVRTRTWLALCLLLTLISCSRISNPLEAPLPGTMTITIIADGESRSHSSSAEIVADALVEAHIHLGELDRVEPNEYANLEEGMVIRVVRVIENFETELVDIPFREQEVLNEAISEDEDPVWIQGGRNGVEEIVYRVEYHDGEVVERRVARRTVIQPPTDQIVMVGAKGIISPVPIQGALAYISGGNGVVMRVSSGNRDTIVSSSDLDGRVFALSPGGEWLLYTRSIPAGPPVTDTLPAFNSLWVINTNRFRGPIRPQNLRVENVLWADWSPKGELIAYSTAIPIQQPPGWEANNDLWLGDWDDSGEFRPALVLEPSSGGIYGWWGANYVWSPDGRYLAYGRSDQVGVIQVASGGRSPLHDFSVYHTYGDWVWTPIPTWSPDNDFLAAVVHGPPIGAEAAEDSQLFDLWVWALDGRVAAPLANRVGMWGMPAWSPSREEGDESASLIAFLQASDPLESASARYALWVMDRDGSNRRLLFPPAGEIGLVPQPVAWSPEGDQIALVYKGNLYLVNALDGSARPLTGDGINSNPVWATSEAKPIEVIPGLPDLPIE